jgi:S1-C subfamily serine protease
MATPTPSLSAFSAQLADLVERASSFVVSVGSRHRRPGSGFIVGPDLVVTADHVLDEDEHISIRIGDRRLTGEIAGLGGSEPQRSDTVRPGQLVLSVSRAPTAATPAAGFGVVAALGGPLRTGGGVVLRQVFRTNASTYPGASGGAILDTDGRVLGMTTSGLLRGLPVVIPSPQLWELTAGLAANKKVKRAYLGVSVQPVRFPKPAADGPTGGLLVSGLAADGAAHRAGLLVGDVIVAIDEAKVAHADDLQDRLAATEAGGTIRLGVVRAGSTLQLPVATDAR